MKGIFSGIREIPFPFHNSLSQIKSFRFCGLIAILSAFFLLVTGCWSQKFHYNNGSDEIDLTNLSFEELLDVEFITVFKKQSTIFEAPAAVYVVDEEDIEASGAMNIPDILRGVPGIQVAQHNANSWSVTSRGFSGLSRGISGQFANKLLVLKDGRTIYTPLFSGVSWGAQDVLLDDVARMEIIRGPGASLWGANAVNGIINVVSKEAQETQGLLVSTGFGSELQAFGHFRYGGALGKESFYRLYGKYSKVDDLVDAAGNSAADGWNLFRSGFRVDSYLDGDKTATLQGEVYQGDLGQTFNIVDMNVPPYQRMFNSESDISGGHLLGRFQQDFSTTSELELQVYFDRVKRNEPSVKGRIHTFDFDFHHRFAANTRNEIIWGGGYRLVADKFDSTFNFSLNPRNRKTNLFNIFIQNELSIIPEYLSLTLGSKFEHNDYTGLELQPSARLLWSANQENVFWSAVSRAIRSPSRGEREGRLISSASDTTTSPTFFQGIFGSENFKSEELLAVEGGYRYRPDRNFSLDLVTFYNQYNDLRTDEPTLEVLREPPNFVLTNIISNQMSGHTYGIEISTNLQVSPSWHLNAAYNYLKMSLNVSAESKDTFAEKIDGQSPNHQFFFNSFLKPSRSLDFDFRFRYIDNLPNLGIPSYATIDLRVGWQITTNFEISVIGQNLLESRHAESSSSLSGEMDATIQSGTIASEIQRSVFTKIILKL